LLRWIDIGVARLATDFVHCVAGPNFRCAFQFAQEIELRERFSKSITSFFFNNLLLLPLGAGITPENTCNNKSLASNLFSKNAPYIAPDILHWEKSIGARLATHYRAPFVAEAHGHVAQLDHMSCRGHHRFSGD
jgi:hypothetical protein